MRGRLEHTLDPVPIKFIGVIDTVKAVDDARLYDIDQTANVLHVRHALAILEARASFTPERYARRSEADRAINAPARSRTSSTAAGAATVSESQSSVTGVFDILARSCIEAWFFGAHGNLGGSQAHDGLSLWPLQYILSEARKSGLVLSFQPLESAMVASPLEQVFPPDQPPQAVAVKNGRAVDMWDLSTIFTMTAGLEPIVQIAKTNLGIMLQGERDFYGLKEGDVMAGDVIGEC
jgi:hypothetical protein